METTEVFLDRLPLGPATAADVERLVADHVGIQGWTLTQSPLALRFGPIGSEPVRVQGSTAGRAFNATCEVRWVRNGNAYEAWRIQEAAAGERVRRWETTVYLHGVYKLDTDNGPKMAFHESHLQQTDFVTLYSWMSGLQPEDRLCLRVAEYGIAKPLAGEDFEVAINQPRVIAHRVLGVNRGQDQEPHYAG